MQHLFLAQALQNGAQTVNPDQLAQQIGEVLHNNLQGFVFIFLIQQAFSIIAFWVASKTVGAEERGTFDSAVKVWGGYWLSWLSWLAFVIVVGGILIVTHTTAALVLLMIVAMILALVIIFAVPIHVYEFGFLRTVGFCIVSLVFSSLFSIALSVLPLAPRLPAAQVIALYSLTPDKQQYVFRLVTDHLIHRNASTAAAALPGEAIAADPTKPMEERKQAIVVMFNELETRRKALDQNDAAGIARYNADRARYEAILAKLRSDVAAGS